MEPAPIEVLQNFPKNTKERILRTAAELFAAQGYHATGVAELGRAAGIQRGALYYHIRSKEELLFELCKRHVEDAVVFGEEVLAGDAEPAEKLRQLIHRHLRMIVEHRAEIIVSFREMHSLTGGRAEYFHQLRDRYEAIVRAILQEGVERGQFRSADSIVVNGLLGLISYAYLWLDPNGPLSPDDVAERFADLALHGLAVTEPFACTSLDEEVDR
ncbi:MAG TPA: TetR/AcrR family transcriptional regulator [Acidimicrobiia bacterium]|nr:TetR/AcrR family transcriptional regulator [Acidimicrobiia bacterium]